MSSRAVQCPAWLRRKRAFVLPRVGGSGFSSQRMAASTRQSDIARAGGGHSGCPCYPPCPAPYGQPTYAGPIQCALAPAASLARETCGRSPCPFPVSFASSSPPASVVVRSLFPTSNFSHLFISIIADFVACSVPARKSRLAHTVFTRAQNLWRARCPLPSRSRRRLRNHLSAALSVFVADRGVAVFGNPISQRFYRFYTPILQHVTAPLLGLDCAALVSGRDIVVVEVI